MPNTWVGLGDDFMKDIALFIDGAYLSSITAQYFSRLRVDYAAFARDSLPGDILAVKPKPCWAGPVADVEPMDMSSLEGLPHDSKR